MNAFGAILVILISIVMFLYAKKTARSLEIFWKSYPLIRYFPARQFSVNPIYVRLLALILCAIGAVSLIRAG